jgi:hypothetical protein
MHNWANSGGRTMPMLIARTALPLLFDWMKQAGAYELTSAELKRLRNEANKGLPSKSTFDQLVYGYQLIRKVTAVQVVDIFNHHFKRSGLSSLDGNAIIDFDSYVSNFGTCVNILRSRGHRGEDDAVGNIASVSGYSEETILSLMKNRLVPHCVATNVCNAATSSYGSRHGDSYLTVVQVPLNQTEYRPVAVGAGRRDIIDKLRELTELPPTRGGKPKLA